VCELADFLTPSATLDATLARTPLGPSDSLQLYERTRNPCCRNSEELWKA
jgi:hypothetical protein